MYITDSTSQLGHFGKAAGSSGKIVFALDETRHQCAGAVAVLEVDPVLVRLNEVSSRLWQSSTLEDGLNEMLRAAIGLLSADKGNIQLLDSARNALVIAAHQGFAQPFLDFFREVSAEDNSACGRALRAGSRILIEDVGADEGYAPFRAVAAEAGYRAVQSTPLIGRGGIPLGMISTHFSEVHRPAEQDLQLFDLYARQAAGFIERHQAGEKLKESEERYRSIYERAATGIVINDLDGRYRACNLAYTAMSGYSEEELCQLTFEDVVHPEEVDSHMTEVRRLLVQEIPSVEITSRCIPKSGGTLWVHKHLSLLKDGNGKPAGILSLITDITERVRHEEQIELLMREVNHRSKNILTLVQAIAMQTAKGDPATFIRRFDQRLCALAASYDLLVKNDWKGAALQELIRSQLAHFSDLIGKRISLQGPPVLITSSAAQVLGMTIHELATNAGKYGALSNMSGQVYVTWEIVQDREGGQAFTISWRERSGPPVTVPAHQGFGTTLMCRMAEGSLHAEVGLVYKPEGVTWQLKCALGDIAQILDEARGDARPARTERPAKRPRVLVVEDEAPIAREISTILTDAGFEVVGPALAAAHALELIRVSGCDAAVLDVRLGRNTSEPVALKLKERGTPFIVVSAFGQVPEAFGNQALLAKPLQSELLLAHLRRCLKRQG